MNDDLTDEHRRILSEIDAAKAATPRDNALVTKLARQLTRLDDRTPQLKAGLKARHGAGHSKSPSFGRYRNDDE